MFEISFLVIYVLPGVFGGLVRGLVGISKNVMGKKKNFRLSRLLLSLLIAMIVGAFAGVVANGDWRISMLAGYAGPDLLESLYKTRLFGMFKKF